MLGDSYTSALLQRALDGTWQRERAISSNIANSQTPGYKALTVSFEDSLLKEVDKIEKSQMTPTEIRQGIQDVLQADIATQQDYTTSERLDGNNVNLDVENIEMARTQIQYQYLIRSMTDMFSRMRYAISEGKK